MKRTNKKPLPPRLQQAHVSGCAFQSVEEKTQAVKSLIIEQYKLIDALSKLLSKPPPKYANTAIKRCMRIVGITMKCAAIKIQIDTINSQKINQ